MTSSVIQSTIPCSTRRTAAWWGSWGSPDWPGVDWDDKMGETIRWWAWHIIDIGKPCLVVPICSHQIWAFHWMVSLEPFLAFGSGLIIPVMLEQDINHWSTLTATICCTTSASSPGGCTSSQKLTEKTAHRRQHPLPATFGWFHSGPLPHTLELGKTWAVKKTTILTLCTHKGLSRILSFYFRGHNAGFRETTATTTSFADLSRWKGKSCNRGHDSWPSETFS